ncbi:hypothetical protein ACQKNC_15435 [Lysinibacillus sp. NPDC094177]|uniref:hypothetical protein n=1 Tax=Lysinibacillus sp. NPDC094177 TaxID=3390580 RepID=UPI003D02C92F
MSRLGQQMLFVRKRSVNVAAAKCFCLRESVVQRSDSNSTDIGHEGVITGRGGFSLRSSIADPQGVAQPSLQSTNIHNIRFNKNHPQLLVIIQHIPNLYK